MARQPNTTTSGGSFDADTIEAVWRKSTPEPGPASFRKDIFGTSMQRADYGRTTLYGWEIDHIKPVSEGGTDALDNLQPLQWENNRRKGDNYPYWGLRENRKSTRR